MTKSGKKTRIAIIGIGNLLLRDDGVGVHAARELMKSPPDGAVVTEIGVAALDAMPVLEESDVVIAIDAVQAGGQAGSIYRFDGKDAELPGKQFSLHSLGVAGVLRLMPEETRPEVIVLGVEPKAIEYGMELTPETQAALPRLLETVRQTVREIQQG